MKTENETYSALGEVGDFQQKRTRWARIRLDLAKSPMTQSSAIGNFDLCRRCIVCSVYRTYGEAEVFPIPTPLEFRVCIWTDQIGRDIFSRLIYGARNTVGIAVATTALAFIIGGVLGLAAAIARGWLDQLLSRTSMS